MKTKTILATAYAINPYKGSEDAMGWNYVDQIARHHKVIAITRENNKPQIEKYMQEHPLPHYANIRFAYFDLPLRYRFWKKGQKGALLYYLLWQIFIISFIKKNKFKFDVSHNLNFHNDWTPSFLYKLHKPMVWGPIGHHPKVKNSFTKHFDTKEKLKNYATWIIKKYFWNFSRSLKKCLLNADFVWAMNDSVADVLNLKNKSKLIYPSVATADYCPNYEYKPSSFFKVISIGRFVPLKGFDIGLEAFATFYFSLPLDDRKKCELQFIGKGPDELKLRKLAKSLKISHCVTFTSWLPRLELMELYKDASVFLFPSHEGAGMVIPEAMSFGLPCICLDNSGPGQFVNENCGIKVKEETYEKTTSNIALGLNKLYSSKLTHQKLSKGARMHYLNVFTWEKRGDQLKNIYKNL